MFVISWVVVLDGAGETHSEVQKCDIVGLQVKLCFENASSQNKRKGVRVSELKGSLL